MMEVVEMRKPNIETGIGHSSKGNQLDAAEALFGCYLKFGFPRRKITQAEFDRVEETLRYQAGKYLYMFEE